MGNLTRDPEVASTQSGIPYCRFTIAVNRPYKNANNDYDVDFIDCIAWKERGERIAQFFSKGKKIGVRGQLQISMFTDKDGNKRKGVDLQVEDFFFVSPKGEGGHEPVEPRGGGSNTPQSKQNPKEPPMSSFKNEDDDLPF